MKGGAGFAKPGMPADGEILVEGASFGPKEATGDDCPCRDSCARALEAIRRRSRPSGNRFRHRQGEIFGLIGPDGAGKTTTFQIWAA